MMKKLLQLLFIASLAASAAACNTIEGFGQDVEEAGDEIEETANANK